MEVNKKVNLQFLHFNDTYDIRNTPLFTASLHTCKSDFLKKEIPEIMSQNKLFRKSTDLTFAHKKTFNQSKKT